MTQKLLPVFLLSLMVSASFAQRGDRKGHVMTPPPEEWHVPAPPLSPEEALQSFKFGEEGFRIELVASEPAVVNPVCVTFDGNGRMWVCEMTGYMPDADGNGEDVPNGRISVLEDTNGDGAADKSTVFIDKIVLPRAVQLVNGGILWADQTKLYFTERKTPTTAGETTVVDDKWATSGNVEHKTNGLLYGRDNWLHNAKSSARYRQIDGEWVKEKTETRGQWGITQDDFGRILTNSNSTFMRMELLPPGYSQRNPNYTFDLPSSGISSAVWPIRITCGINRGYQSGMLTEDGFLTRCTGTCGPGIYRGDQFPAEYYGNAFIPEPCGMLVKRATIVENEKGFLETEQAYSGKEFLASMDERNRFVNAYTAPDGSLYLVDMVHGLIQHKTYVTSYLRGQMEKRGLEEHNNDRGRIFRVRFTGNPLGEAPKMEDESSAQLVKHLNHPNGWWRDMAQQLIVQRQDKSAVKSLRKTAAAPEIPQAAINALWALDGLGELDGKTLQAAANSDDKDVLATAARLAGTLAGTDNEPDALAALQTVVSKENRKADLFAVASLAQMRGAGKDGARSLLLETLAIPERDDRFYVFMAMSGLAGAESELLGAAAKAESPIFDPLVTAIANSGDSKAVQSLLAEAGGFSEKMRTKLFHTLGKTSIGRGHKSTASLLLTHAQNFEDDRKAVFAGILNGGKQKGFKKIHLKDAPGILAEPGDDKTLQAVAKLFDFSGKGPVKYIKTAEHKKQFELGKVEYSKLCIACHQANGQGLKPLAPPLVDSEWVTGSENRLIALTLDGMQGPVTVNGTLYQAPDIQPVMPGLRVSPDLDDKKLAAILTYVRNEWGNGAPPVSEKAVKAWREGHSARAPYTEAELKKVK